MQPSSSSGIQQQMLETITILQLISRQIFFLMGKPSSSSPLGELPMAVVGNLTKIPTCEKQNKQKKHTPKKIITRTRQYLRGSAICLRSQSCRDFTIIRENTIVHNNTLKKPNSQLHPNSLTRLHLLGYWESLLLLSFAAPNHIYIDIYVKSANEVPITNRIRSTKVTQTDLGLWQFKPHTGPLQQIFTLA